MQDLTYNKEMGYPACVLWRSLYAESPYTRRFETTFEKHIHAYLEWGLAF